VGGQHDPVPDFVGVGAMGNHQAPDCCEAPCIIATYRVTRPLWESGVASCTPGQAPPADEFAEEGQTAGPFSAEVSSTPKNLAYPSDINPLPPRPGRLATRAVLLSFEHQGISSIDTCTGLASRGRFQKALTASLRYRIIQESFMRIDLETTLEARPDRISFRACAPKESIHPTGEMHIWL